MHSGCYHGKGQTYTLWGLGGRHIVTGTGSGLVFTGGIIYVISGHSYRRI